uniref:Serine/threonine-protein phosphatase with EF-hands n=1 Tax=Culicoides sonorensis TaxID=179676 RepID=A0A336KZ48_CULSO
MKAAILIQQWYRTYLARIEVRRRYTWTIFQNIEYAGEQDQVRVNALDLKFSDESDDLADEGLSGPERTYRGPHIDFPMTRKDLDIIIDLFRKKKYHLHAKYVAGILREAASKLKRLPNLNQASTAISKQVTICGDLHGKLDDLLVVFHKNGLPSPENPYVFNGDFVDRGKKGLEVLLLLVSCLLVFPGGVFLNRGNHEDTVMNARYGFIREVHQKYKHNAERLLKLIDEVYRWLPLGTIVNNGVLVVHGGISDSTDLDLIRSLDRGKVFDILWSDPQPNDGCRPNSLRGAGTYFGPDVSNRFLQRNKLQFLVRSHECKPDGYECIHSDKVITIFSASNYYEIGSNKGAYLKLDPHLNTHFVQYTAAASKTRKLTFRQRVGLVESSALRELGAKLYDKRAELEKEFKSRDPDDKGVLPLSKWCEALEAATHLGLPWRMLRERLSPPEPDTPPTEVDYVKTLVLLDTDAIREAQAGSTSVAESLYKNKSSLETIFKILDKDNSGYISLDEFDEACKLLRQHFPFETHEQLMAMCRMMDINKDGLVDLNEFLEAFRLCESTKESLSTSALAKEPPKTDPGAKKLEKNGSVTKESASNSNNNENHIPNGKSDNSVLKSKSKVSIAQPEDTDDEDDNGEDAEVTEKDVPNKTVAAAAGANGHTCVDSKIDDNPKTSKNSNQLNNATDVRA